VSVRALLALGLVAAVAWAAPVAAETETPLTLKEALRIARGHHPTIEAQRGQATSAHGRQEQALARLLPFLQASAAYQPTTPNFVVNPAQSRVVLSQSGRDTVTDVAGAPVTVFCATPGMGNCASPSTGQANVWTPESFWLANVGLSWTAWDWGRSILGYRSARALSAASDVGVQASELDVALQVELAFYGALAADEQLAVAEDAVKTYDAHLTQTGALHDAGLRTAIDVATAESARASAEIGRARALAGRTAARAQLQVAMGVSRWDGWRLVPDAAAFEAQADDEARAAAPLATLVETADARRPDLESLRLEERGLGAAVSATRGSYLPQLTLSVSPTWGGRELGALTPNLTWMVALGYPSPGLSPWFVHGQTREAEGNLVTARAQRRALLDAVRAETTTAQAGLVAALDELRFARTLVAASGRQRGLAEGRYQTGVGNVIELYDALLTDVNARSQLVQARLDLASARARLRHALGDRAD
jgi:outer membrane protein TolC